MKSPAGRPVLLGALRDDNPEVRAIAAKGVSDVVLPEDTPALRALLKDDDGRVAAEAVRGLVTLATRCGPGPCTPVDALGELDARASGLGAASLPQGIPPLLALAQAPVPESARRVLVRLRAASAPRPRPRPSRWARSPPGSTAGWPVPRTDSGDGWTRRSDAATAASRRSGGSSSGWMRSPRARALRRRGC